MPHQVWKFSCSLSDCFTLELPQAAKILHFSFQGDIPCIWAVVDPEAPKVKRNFRFAGTGHPLEEKHYERLGFGEIDNFHFIGTAFTGPLVFHLFEVTMPAP